MNTLSHCVYVLLSLKDGQFYIGLSSNLQGRMRQHDAGDCRSTESRRPFLLVHTEHYLSQRDARRREDYFKTTIGKRVLRLMLRDSLRNLRASGS